MEKTKRLTLPAYQLYGQPDNCTMSSDLTHLPVAGGEIHFFELSRIVAIKGSGMLSFLGFTSVVAMLTTYKATQ
jgi:hypothetical protein